MAESMYFLSGAELDVPVCN